MSHFAEVKDGIVVTVIVADQEYVDTLEGTWIQTSYNTHSNVHFGQDEEPDGGVALRKNYAGAGDTYDSTADAFHQPSPFPSWSLNATTFIWEAPVAYPLDDTSMYLWDEANLKWVESFLPDPE
jgi:hypothetical protein